MNTVTVTVNLKMEVLDPQGRAIFKALTKLGCKNLVDVRQNKQFKLYFNSTLDSKELLEIESLASELLCNSVIEDFIVEVEGVA